MSTMQHQAPPAAQACGDADLVAEAHLLRAAALLELGESAGRDELLAYAALAETWAMPGAAGEHSPMSRIERVHP
jgi:hypothetical protein